MSQRSATRVFILIPTHTTRHLAACLSALAHQTRAPSGIVVSCDTDESSVGELLKRWWPRVMSKSPVAPRLIYTFRSHCGSARPNQVRNNGLRALHQLVGLRDDDLVLGVDGDTMLEPHAIEKHVRFADAGSDVIISHRFMIDEKVTQSLHVEELLASGIPADEITTPHMHRALSRLDMRYRFHLFLARLRLTKSHKPKILGAHYAVRYGRLIEVNGFDEEYEGAGFDDCDLSRRLRRLHVSTRIAIKQIHSYHLWHPPRAPARVKESTGYNRWIKKDLPVRCVRGLEDPVQQAAPTIEWIG